MDDHNDTGYDVGYGKPPKGSRWRPGQSGNPKGRPKKPKDLETLFEDELNRSIQITENGQTIRATKREVLAKRLVADAIRGDIRSTKLVLDHLSNQRPVESFEADAEDAKALQRLLAQRRGGETGDKSSNESGNQNGGHDDG